MYHISGTGTSESEDNFQIFLGRVPAFQRFVAGQNGQPRASLNPEQKLIVVELDLGTKLISKPMIWAYCYYWLLLTKQNSTCVGIIFELT